MSVEIVNNHQQNNYVSCCALLSSKKGKRCSYKHKHIIQNNGISFHLCSRHYKMGLNKIKTIYSGTPRCIVDNGNKIIDANSMSYSTNFMDKLVKIQSYMRKCVVRKNIKNRGISVYCRHLCNNSTDCSTFEDIKNIPNHLYFSFKSSSQYWGFHIATLKELLKYTKSNPYNTCDIEDSVINKFKKLIDKQKNIEVEKDVIHDPSIKLNQRCVKIFQIMDNLKQYTQCSWFLDLNILQLKELYKQLEDLWNYRINMSINEKKRYVKNGILFADKVQVINKVNSKIKLGNILLDNFEKLVTEGENSEFCTTGSLWILSGLTIVSKNARDALPWLYQSAHPGQ